ncbi:glutamine synthetase family protein [Pseudomonas rubra]|uniref:Glutamine synthetase family protein n=1 Tax=Pseudomonas rubra TaxID=2942627 RepID=A0ABT5PA61_9PSED|nr:glutamine synthetase family protein [Pseudomonas rubra]MDD1015194.1 glutamine synthetase family protein [Pseudomonas rubra]MDD1037848.1 glutamine synthetase family protein [Pseudomonas rubra]MDD1152824.1 glutamine synthetase family protein [Pseudomonas rubra]
MNTPADQLKKQLKQQGITEVECMISDFCGIARGKIAATGKFLEEGGMRLPESVLLQTVTGDYVDDQVFHALLDEAGADMFCRPAPHAVFVLPWLAEPTAMVIHDSLDKFGKPIELSPRNALKRVLDLYADNGWRPVVAPELEFYLTRRSHDPDLPLEAPNGRSGRPERGRQSFSIDATHEFAALFEDLYQWCDVQQLDLDTLSHESGPAQMEVNFRHGDALRLADQLIVFKRTLHEAALKHGVSATFMAKPIAFQPGSAMHIHQSVQNVATGKNLFATDDGAMSKQFLHYIGGLQRYIPQMLPLFAPNVNSFRRFLPDNCAPVNVAWGHENRTVGLRVPTAPAAGLRVENRLPGADANPYLAMAATLLCGYLGILEELSPCDPLQGRAYDHCGLLLPNTLEDALSRMEECDVLKQYLGCRFVQGYVAVKRTEHGNYSQVISSWEREYLQSNV